MNNFHKWWLGILTFIVVAETTLIGIYCCSKLEINSNSPSVLISALGVLVTFVVAWQIWQTMASRDEIRKATEVTQEIGKLKDNLELLKNVPDGYLFYTLAIIKYGENKYFDAFDFYHSAIRCFIRDRIDYAKFTTVALDSMFDCIEYATEEELNIFRLCSARVDNMISAIEHDVENVNRLADEAKKKVARIKENARKHKIIS